MKITKQIESLTYTDLQDWYTSNEAFIETRYKNETGNPFDVKASVYKDQLNWYKYIITI